MAVVRPSDWFLVELDRDPTPGDAFGIRQLAGKYAEIANIAGDAAVSIRRARSSSASSAWVGDAGDIFRDRSERMPGELSKANDSYQQVADALSLWASTVDDTQAQADRGLQQARDAAQDLHAAQLSFGAAQLSWTSLHAQQLTYQKLVKQYRDVPPPPYVTLPTDHQIRSVDRGVQQAQSAMAVAQAHVSDAEARLAAAKVLVMEAKSRRDEAEKRVVHQIGVAGDAAVQPSSIWEAIQDSAAWQTIVQVATVVLTIVSIVAIIVGGPLVWALIAAATVLLMVDALLSIAQGKDAWGELIMLGIGLIPGGRLLPLGSKAIGAGARFGMTGARVARITDRIEQSATKLTRTSRLQRAATTSRRVDRATSPEEALPLTKPSRPGDVAIEYVDPATITDNPVWRTTDEVLTRSDGRLPDDIFENGLVVKDITNTNYAQFVANNERSAFISTTRDTSVSGTWNAGRNFQYEIHAPGGIDANATLGQHPHFNEFEVSFPGGIRPEFIAGARKIHDDYTVGDFIPNPKFIPPSMR